MKKLQFFYCICIALTCSLISCVKGETGPPGPAGADGADGADGQDGAPGPDNVYYSSWMRVQMADTIDIHADTTYYQNFRADALTSDIINSGMILTYLQTVDAYGDSLIFNASTALTETYYIGDIFAVSFPTAASNSAGIDYTGYNYRFIIIPGAIATTMFKGMTPQQIKTINYPVIAKLLNLPATGSSSRKFNSQ
jgi:hypothetical protein